MAATQQNDAGFAALPPEIMFMILDILVEEEMSDPKLTRDPTYPDYYAPVLPPFPAAYLPTTPAAPWDQLSDGNGFDESSGPYHSGAGTQPLKPVAFPPNSQLTKTLISLSLVCRSVYPYGLRYLYTHCLYIDHTTKFAILRHTLGRHLHATENEPKNYVNELWRQSDVLRYVQGVYISFGRMQGEGNMINRTGGFQGLGHVLSHLGTSLKRLVIDLESVSMTTGLRPQSQQQYRGVLSNMTALQDLVISCAAVTYFSAPPPPNLRRLCIMTPNLFFEALDFSSAISSLETLIILRPPNLTAKNIETWFDAFTTQRSLDIVLVDQLMHHKAPINCRAWDDEKDNIKIWEADATPSWYVSHEEHWVTSANWCCARANDGSLWSVEKRRLGERERQQRDMLAHGGGPILMCGYQMRSRVCHLVMRHCEG